MTNTINLVCKKSYCIQVRPTCCHFLIYVAVSTSAIKVQATIKIMIMIYTAYCIIAIASETCTYYDIGFECYYQHCCLIILQQQFLFNLKALQYIFI